ncbi:hypothetical protein [Paenibacillus thermotolerans]|uniref:hypothetical protein n=1 Tax=Paenibacillus thermotolerans TaxID=3027807 RepID=UPI002368AE86|nr:MULTISPECIES: hypothetical protein [unclassified Paenibacillus]
MLKYQGLGKTVHKKLDQHINHFFKNDYREKFVFDHVQVMRSSQFRTVIMFNHDSYFCKGSFVDFTKYVRGNKDFESELFTFHLPLAAVKALTNDYVGRLERNQRIEVDESDEVAIECSNE